LYKTEIYKASLYKEDLVKIDLYNNECLKRDLQKISPFKAFLHKRRAYLTYFLKKVWKPAGKKDKPAGLFCGVLWSIVD